jgi:hypothetical protein
MTMRPIFLTIQKIIPNQRHYAKNYRNIAKKQRKNTWHCDLGLSETKQGSLLAGRHFFCVSKETFFPRSDEPGRMPVGVKFNIGAFMSLRGATRRSNPNRPDWIASLRSQ